MYGCPEEVWAEVAELPKEARRLWRRAFWRAWPQAGGDGRRAAALAWQAFALEAKGRGAGSRGPGTGEADEGRAIEAVGAFLAELKAGLVFFRSWLERRWGKECSPGKEGPRQLAARVPQRRGPELGGGGPGSMEEIFGEAVAKGWLKPEQRPWAEALARRDRQALQEFFELAAAAAGDGVGWGVQRLQREEVR